VPVEITSRRASTARLRLPIDERYWITSLASANAVSVPSIYVGCVFV
jgi:hypothetical protein